MNKFYTDHLYVLYQNNAEYNRFINYIVDFSFTFDMISSIQVQDMNPIQTFNLVDYNTNQYLKLYIDRYKNRQLNINMISHIKSIIKIIQNAIDNNYESITILEYDVFFHKDIYNLLPKYKNLIDNCDIIYLGSSQSYWYNPVTMQKIEYHLHNNSPYYVANHSLGTFAIILKKKLFNEYMELLNSYLFTSDVALCIVSKKYNSVVIYPNIVICDISKSTIMQSRNIKATFFKFKWKLVDYLLPPEYGMA